MRVPELETGDDDHSAYRVQVLDRVFSILDHLAASQSHLGLPELSHLTSLHRSTTHRLLTVLESHRFVDRNASGKYRLGSKLLEFGTIVAARLDVPAVARSFLEQVVRETDETAHMGVLRQGEVVSITNVPCLRTLTAPATVGRRSPVHCSALGKCILSGLSDADVLAVIGKGKLRAYTPNTITRPKALLAELDQVRERGFAVDDEEYEEGMKCVGAPVRDHSGRIIAGISIAGPATRFNERRMPVLTASVGGGAARLSAALGYVPLKTDAVPRPLAAPNSRA